VRVVDNGKGIPADVLPHVFDPFFTTKAEQAGTGLGLHVSQRIASEHGGRLEVESEPGRTVFTLRLPSASAAVPEVAATARGQRILFIDDDELVRRSLRRAFRAPEFVVECASDGLSAIALLERDAVFDWILCDVDLPAKSGIEVLDTIRRRWPSLANRFAFVTGGISDEAMERRIVEAGAPVLEKPIEPQTLIATLRRTRTARPPDE
jgi:CheY-like chemotaxis protein